jgi:hypothetical protein
MAADHSNDDADYQALKGTYDGVCTMFKVSITLIVILLLALAAFVV